MAIEAAPSVGAICPGQRTLFEGKPGDTHYLCAVFFVCWEGEMPSPMDFYLTNHPIKLNKVSRGALEAEVKALIAANVKTPVYSVRFTGYYGFELSAADVADYGWQVISGSAPTA